MEDVFEQVRWASLAAGAATGSVGIAAQLGVRAVLWLAIGGTAAETVVLTAILVKMGFPTFEDIDRDLQRQLQLCEKAYGWSNYR